MSKTSLRSNMSFNRKDYLNSIQIQKVEQNITYHQEAQKRKKEFGDSNDSKR